MTDEKTSSATAITELATENGSACKAIRDSDVIVPRQHSKSLQISDLLLHGQQNAQSLRHLTAITGLDGRTVRKQIENERRSGTPILSDNTHGYYLPGDDAERAQFVASMQCRAGEIMRTAEAVEKAGGDQLCQSTLKG